MVSAPITGRRTGGVQLFGWDGSSLGDVALAGAEPLGFAAGDTNLYRYVGNEAIGETDPSGLDDVTVLPGPPYKGQPPMGGPGGVLKDPALRQKMQQLQREYKHGKEGVNELGIIVVWNPETGCVGWTTKGVTQINHDNIKFEDPQIPGWRMIGTIHTHDGSMHPSVPDDVDNANSRGVPGVILWGPYYFLYGPDEYDARGKRIKRLAKGIDYQNPNLGKGTAC